MSFGRLLATGRCIVSAKQRGRYRLASHALLPTFISPRNPFVQSSNKDATAQTVTPETTAGHLSHQAADAGARVAMPSQQSKSATRASVGARVTGWLEACLKRIRSVTGRARATPRQKSSIPRFDKQPVQGELSLDQVQVLRNDLSDSDLEVVAVRRAGGGRNVAPTESAWRRLTTRVFGAETI